MNEVIGSIARGIGQGMGLRLANENPELTKRVESMGKLIGGMQNAIGQRDNFVVVSGSEVSNEISECGQFNLLNLCIRHEPFFKGIVSAINPDFEFAYDRMKTKGDKDCRWTLRKK